MKKLETYKGIEIWEDAKDTQRPFVTIQNVPVIGSLQTGHKTLEDAKAYIDKTAKP